MTARRSPPRDRLTRWARRHAEHGPTADAIAELEDAYETLARARRGDTSVIDGALRRVAAITVGWNDHRDDAYLRLGDGTQVFLGLENDRVLDVLWTLLDAPVLDSDDPGAHALKALVDAATLTHPQASG